MSKIFDYLTSDTDDKVARLEAELEHIKTHCVPGPEYDRAVAERDDVVKAGRIFDACRQHAEEECAKLWAALEGMVKALEDGEDRGFLHMHIVTALDIARRALEGK